MAYLKVAEARAAAKLATAGLYKSAARTLQEESRSFNRYITYDVFLSHAYQDAEIILGVKYIMEKHGLSVYVDWMEDTDLNRSKVTRETAELLRARLRSSSCLVYAHSSNSPDSTWMPWELGYFDGFKPAHVWILPIVEDYDWEFKSQEYLNLYPTVENISDIAGRLNLGFADVGVEKRNIPLPEASRGDGILFKVG